MKRFFKGIVASALCVSLLCSAGVKAESVNQPTENSNSEELIIAEIAVPEETVMTNVSRIITNGEVDGNGVRLRAKASSSASVLELMYDGEAVGVNPDKTVTKSGTKWYYLKRMKTGTWGYANASYIIYY